MAFIQSNRQLQIKTPLGPNELLILKMEAREELGRLFEFTVDLLSENESVAHDDLLGKKMTVEMDMVNTSKRYFDGYVSQFTQIGHMAYFAHYRATLRPWLWLLTRTSDCRIFQYKTVPDIIKAVFRDNGFTDFEDRLSSAYREWEYCVQYRETDFNFVSRLMEQEGIYYYFKHVAGKHMLILCDDYSSHSVLEAYSEIPYLPPTEAGSSRWTDYIHSWKFTKSVQPGRYAHTDYDFKKPKSDLSANAPLPRSHPYADFEIFDYPGEYEKTPDGETYARNRIEEIQSGYELLEGKGNARGVTTGGLFTLTEHPRGDQNKEYLITAAMHYLHSDAFESVPEIAEGPVYACEFSCSDSKDSYRPARITPKPMVQGPQTAVVVGKSGEEIHTDEYGRVKLQFHWDRYGSNDENSSCWVRVAQVWAGKNWGAMHIPRIGQEVIVDFLEGDPDRPIITGRVYNADQMPPYDLPANMTQSGIKSRSTKGGNTNTFNEIRFEDKKGSEELYIHAEKNHKNITESSRTEQVGYNRSLTVGHDKTETVNNDKTINIVKNHTETIGLNMSHTVGVNQTETIGSNKSETVGINSAETVGAAKELTIGGLYQVTVGGAMNETVAGAKAEEVGGVKLETVGGDRKTSVGGDRGESVGGDLTEEVEGNKQSSIKGKYNIDVSDEYKLEATSKIVMKTGAASISMEPSGKIEVSGTDVTFKTAAGKVHIDAGGIITIKGTMVKINT
ncbi:MAG: type VI secretion system tip protein VgrG [Candidatus Thiodiazotropha sp. (ex Dulcina madagascariensis)]|nr:type VI secretion system tip protein VgrG [Candidatus Thiodiazotropha sp. (ex Epidulcina cf. delphinae)]MCU7921594.1 type VI secretion system tip protein VgrG [Candidatus Thiodiazotropha sp. (ex Dulcina madagascariensis)]